MKWLLLILLTSSCLFTKGAFAEGHGEEKKEHGKEEGKKGEEKEKGGGAEFAKRDASVGQLYAKINTTEKTIRELVEEKNKTKDDTKVRALIEEIKTNMAERKDAIQKYNKEYLILKYQYPEKGKDVAMKYKKFDDRKIKEFEDEVNKELSNVYSNVKQKYGN
jgi:hypothetical protein